MVDVNTAKKVALQEARELMKEFGYKDSEDKEVYENDIVEVGFGEHKGVLGKIIFEYGCFMIESRYNAIFQDSYKSIKYGKVVGNIFENPELLKA